jgi:hypothetical protein
VIISARMLIVMVRMTPEILMLSLVERVRGVRGGMGVEISCCGC